MITAVTGGAGFLGSNVCRVLQGEHEVHSIDNRESKIDYSPSEVTHDHRTSIHEIHDLVCDVLVHCAARADISKNWESRGQRDWVYRSNVAGTINILEALPVTCRHVIFFSTGAVYTNAIGATERDIPTVTSPYAASKLAAEAFVECYARTRGMTWHILRLASAYGYGYHHGHIADFVRQTGHSNCIRALSRPIPKSAIHALDVAHLVEVLIGGRVPSGTYNVAHPSQRWSWNDTFATMRRLRPTLTCVQGEHEKGWVGDAHPVMCTDKLSRYWFARERIEAGVRASLETLGWPGQHV